MQSNIHKLNCPTCKSHLIVKSTIYCAYSGYKIVRCPGCNTPLREIRSDIDFNIERDPQQSIQ